MAIEPPHQFYEALDVKPKPSVRRLCAAKSKHKYIIEGIMLWSSITKSIGHKKTNQWVNKAI